MCRNSFPRLGLSYLISPALNPEALRSPNSPSIKAVISNDSTYLPYANAPPCRFTSLRSYLSESFPEQPSRPSFISTVRHQLFLSLIPLLIMLAFSDAAPQLWCWTRLSRTYCVSYAPAPRNDQRFHSLRIPFQRALVYHINRTLIITRSWHK